VLALPGAAGFAVLVRGRAASWGTRLPNVVSLVPVPSRVPFAVCWVPLAASVMAGTSSWVVACGHANVTGPLTAWIG
jgi:hypothetical protein